MENRIPDPQRPEENGSRIMSSRQVPDNTPSLDRTLGPVDGAAILISNVVGVGIFTTPGIIASFVPNPWAVLGVWLAGGFLAFAGCLAYAELGALRPRSGGEYVYLREAFGPIAGFLTGWISFVAGFSGAIAAGAVAFADYLGRFVPVAANTQPFFRIDLRILTLDPSRRDVVAICVIVLFSAVHIRGLRPGRLLQNSLTSLLVAALVVFIILGFTSGGGSLTHLVSRGQGVGLSKWLLALVLVMFTYSGWNASTYVAEEIRQPARNVPRSLLWGTGVVIVVYLALNLLYLYALPTTKMSGVIRVGDLAAQALFGKGIASLVTALILLSLAGGLSAWIITGPRIYYAMSQDGVFFPAAAKVHPRFHTPAISIAAQAFWSCLLILSGTFEQLVIYTGFAVLLFSAGAVLSLLVLRKKLSKEPRSFKSWGYPVMPAVFILVTFGTLVNAVVESPKTTGAGLLILFLGLPVYFWSMRRGRRR